MVAVSCPKFAPGADSAGGFCLSLSKCETGALIIHLAPEREGKTNRMATSRGGRGFVVWLLLAVCVYSVPYFWYAHKRDLPLGRERS